MARPGGAAKPTSPSSPGAPPRGKRKKKVPPSSPAYGLFSTPHEKERERGTTLSFSGVALGQSQPWQGGKGRRARAPPKPDQPLSPRFFLGGSRRLWSSQTFSPPFRSVCVSSCVVSEWTVIREPAKGPTPATRRASAEKKTASSESLEGERCVDQDLDPNESKPELRPSTFSLEIVTQ